MTLSSGEYPENEKLAGRSDERTTIVNFLEWLQGQGIWLCRNGKFGLYPVSESHDTLTKQYLDIDPDILEQELREMLAALRSEGLKGSKPACAHPIDMYAPHCTTVECPNYAGRFTL